MFRKKEALYSRFPDKTQENKKEFWSGYEVTRTRSSLIIPVIATLAFSLNYKWLLPYFTFCRYRVGIPSHSSTVWLKVSMLRFNPQNGFWGINSRLTKLSTLISHSFEIHPSLQTLHVSDVTQTSLRKLLKASCHYYATYNISHHLVSQFMHNITYIFVFDIPRTLHSGSTGLVL
jgi:hypothetical protein